MFTGILNSDMEVECGSVDVSRAVLDYYQSSAVREYRVHEGDKLHMDCNAPRSLPNATFSWSIARGVDTNPHLLRSTRRVQISSNGTQQPNYLLSSCHRFSMCCKRYDLSTLFSTTCIRR